MNRYLATVCLLWATTNSYNINLVEGMVTRSKPSRTSTSFVRSTKGRTTIPSPVIPKPQSKSPSPTTPSKTYYEDSLYDNSAYEDDDDMIDFDLEVDSFQQLQRSLGSEIVDFQLQQQIDSATASPNMFLDAHDSDASYLEKIAMFSIPEQLPRPAIQALNNNNNNNNNGQQSKSKKQYAFLHQTQVQRISPDEEIQLGRLIQRGVALHKLKADHEEQNGGKKLSRNEWANFAGLDSTAQLRREVANYRRAKQLLVSANIGLVHAVVKKQYSADTRKRVGLSYDELIQEGSLGLLRAAELFDPKRGLRFSTYATVWIKGVLSNSQLTETIKLPARDRTKWNKIMKAHADLMQEKGLVDQEPTAEQVASRLNMNVEDVLVVQRKMKQTKQVLSLDYEYEQQSRSGSDEAESVRRLENDKNFQFDVDLAERTQMQADVIAAMAQSLTPREARLIRLRYGLTTDGQTRTFRECADAMGLSETRVQQLSKRCLQKLRDAAEAESLDEYLLTIA